MKHARQQEQTTNLVRKMSRYFLALRRQAKRHRAAVLSVMCVVVFATTYALILPAITIDQHTAENEPGMSIASSSSAGNQDATASSNKKADKQEKVASQEAKAAHNTDAEKASDEKEKGAASGNDKTSSDSEGKAASAKLTANKDGYQVTVDYGKDADIAKGAELSVKEYAKDSDEYQAARQKVIEAKKAAGEKVNEDALGFAAFNISILDKDGNKVEPAQGAKVSVKLSADNLPKKIKAKSLQVQHIKDNASDDVETVADAENTEKDTVSLDGTTAKADFTVDSFSTFTLTYYYADSFSRIRVVDENGDSLGTDKGQTIYRSSESLSNLASAANPDSKTYMFVQARVGTSFANAAGTTFTSGTIGCDYSYWYGYDNWYYTTGGAKTYFNDDDILYLVYEPKTVTLTFSTNGGSGTRPSSITGKVGDTVTLPTYSGTRDGYTFLGWTDTKDLTGDVNYHEVYPAGSEYVLSADTTLYAAWSNNNGISRSDFYVQLGGTIPTEPGSYPATSYTSGIRIDNNVKDKRWIIDTAWTSISGANAQNNVTANLNSMPSVDQLVADINKSSSKLGFTVKNSGGELVVASITNSTTNKQKYNVSEGDALYVLWYAQKLQSTSGVGNTWHVDGVLLVKNKVTLTYVKNTDSVVGNMLRGYQTPQDTQVVIGADGSAQRHGDDPHAHGLQLPWLEYGPDGSGKAYSNNATYTLSEDTTLYAQWERKTTGITVYKVDKDDTSKNLDGAKFKLTKKNGDTYEAVKINGVTDDNGIFTVTLIRHQVDRPG
jgi:uncharacterized repeat protein (TIGR02543 family)